MSVPSLHFRPVLVCAALAAALIAPVDLLHREADAWRGAARADEELRWMPSGRSLKVSTLGYSGVAADLLWLRAVNLFGGRYDPEGGDADWLRWLYHLVDLVTDLDPRYRSAYLHGGTLLRLHPDWVSQSTLVFDKGARALPTVWTFPFHISMNYYLHLHDVQEAARYMRRAATLPGSPFYLRSLAATMLDRAKELDTALAFVREELKTTQEPHVRVALEVKETELRYRIAARDLQQARDRFREARGREARSVRELVPEFIGSVPQDPFGGRWVLDAGTEVYSDRHAAWRAEIHERTGLGTGLLRERDAEAPIGAAVPSGGAAGQEARAAP